jgi:hypothetical protein
MIKNTDVRIRYAWPQQSHALFFEPVLDLNIAVFGSWVNPA